jgi:putative membrane protein insertion efficiency factor
MRTIDLWLGWVASRLVRLYQLAISPALPPCCRYYPTCSEYGRVSYERHGFVYGTYLTAYRILRCNPWSHGGFDPVPPRKGEAVDLPQFYVDRDIKRGVEPRLCNMGGYEVCARRKKKDKGDEEKESIA